MSSIPSGGPPGRTHTQEKVGRKKCKIFKNHFFKSLLSVTLIIIITWKLASYLYLISSHKEEVNNAHSYSESSYESMGPKNLNHEEDITQQSHNCNAFGWTKRKGRVKIYYAVVFGNELRTLDILLHEIHQYVDKIYIVEANRTHQNKPKPSYLSENMNILSRFRKVEVVSLDKLAFSWESLKKSPNRVTESLSNRISKRGDNILGHRMEWAQRGFMAKALLRSNIADDDIVIFADADEIISARMLLTLRRCKPRENHFNVCLQNFIYGFSCPGPNSWYGNSIRTGKSFLSSVRAWDKNPLTLPSDPKFTQRFASRSKFCTKNEHPKPSYYTPINLEVKNFGWHLSSFVGYDADGYFRLRDKYKRGVHILKDDVDAENLLESCTIPHKSTLYNESLDEVHLPWYVKKNSAYFHNLLNPKEI